MTIEELEREWERRREDARRCGYTAPVANVYAVALEDLRSLDGNLSPDRMMKTTEAARILGVAPKTIASWAADGRFAGARKTSSSGEWRLPSRAVYDFAGSPPNKGATAIPKLWREE